MTVSVGRRAGARFRIRKSRHRALVVGVLGLVVTIGMLVVPHPGRIPVAGGRTAEAFPTVAASPEQGPPPGEFGAPSTTPGPLQTELTLGLPSDTLYPGNHIFSSLREPWYAAYASSVDLLYVSSGCTVQVFDPGTLAVVATLSTRGCGVVYLPSTGMLYLSSAGNVSVVDPENDSVVATIPAAEAGQATYGLFVYDAHANAIVVGEAGSGTAEVVNLTLGHVVANLSVGFNTVTGTYDPVNGQLYLAGYENNTLEIVNSSTWKITYVPLPTELFGFMEGVAVDTLNGNVYLTTVFYCPSCYGTDYLVEISGANNSVLKSASVGAYTTGIVYDAAVNALFVADSIRNAVYVVNPATLVPSMTIPTPTTTGFLEGAWWPTYVPVLDSIYVPTSYDDSLFAISDLNLTVYASAGGNLAPQLAAWDGSCACLAVGDYLDQALLLIDTASYKTLDTIALPGEPRSITFDPASGQLWVALGGIFGSSGMDVLSGTNGTSVALLASGTLVQTATYDAQDDRMYVPAPSANFVYVFNATNLSLLQKVPISGPTGTAWDSANDEVYVTSWLSYPATDNVTVLDGSTGAVVVNITGIPAPDTIAYDPTTDQIFTGDQNAPNITIIDPSTNTVAGNVSYAYPTDILPESGTGFLFLSNASGNVTQFNVSNGSSVPISAGTETVGMAWLPSGVLAATDPTGGVYFLSATPLTPLTTPALSISPGVVSVGKPVNLTTSVTGGTLPLRYAYSGLPTNCPSVNSSTLSCSPARPGVYSVTVAVTDAVGEVARATATLWVTGGYRVTLSETGLPNGTEWWTNLTDGESFASLSSEVGFLEPNGTYTYTFQTPSGQYHSAGGSLTVGGAWVNRTVTFVLETYNVTFSESGLAAGVEWFVNLTGGTSHPSTTGTVEIALPNGSHPFTIGSADLRYSSPGGDIFVSGGPGSVTVEFTEITFNLTVSETGLPNGTRWSVTVAGSTVYSSNASLVVGVPNGSYTLSLGSVPGYSPTNGSPTVTVHGEPASAGVVFQPSSPGTSGSGFLGLPGNDGYYVLALAGAAIAAGVGAVVLARYRRSRRPPAASEFK